MDLVAKFKQFFNPINMLIITSMFQGLWLTLIVIDANKHWYFAGFVHIFCLGLNSWTLYLNRRVMFISIWNSAVYYQLQAQKVLNDSAQDNAEKPAEPR